MVNGFIFICPETKFFKMVRQLRFIHSHSHSGSVFHIQTTIRSLTCKFHLFSIYSSAYSIQCCELKHVGVFTVMRERVTNKNLTTSLFSSTETVLDSNRSFLLLIGRELKSFQFTLFLFISLHLFAT